MLFYTRIWKRSPTYYHICTAKRQLNVVAQSCHMSTPALLLLISYSISLQGDGRNQSQTYVDTQFKWRHSMLSALMWMSHDIIHQTTTWSRCGTTKKQSEFIFFDSCGLKCVLYRTYLFIVVLSLLFGVEKCYYADYELEF